MAFNRSSQRRGRARRIVADTKEERSLFPVWTLIVILGCTALWLFGAKIYIGRPDNDIINGKRDLSWAKELGYDRLPDFDADVLLDDGDTIELGNTSIRCLIKPGHTEGTVSFFFPVEIDGKTYRAGMFGGAGINQIKKSFLKKQ